MAERYMYFAQSVPVGGAGPGATPGSRWQQIAEAAYLRAQARSFAPGRELDDWLEAEREVVARLADEAYRR